MRTLKAFVTIALLSAVACEKTGTGITEPDPSQFDITISSGTKPTYSWPGPTAFSVSVVRLSAPNTIVWGVMDGTVSIASPMPHGGTSPGAGSTGSSELTLTPGVAYRVLVTRQDVKTGWKDFTP